MHLIPRIFFRDLRGRLIIHFSFEMPIKIQFYLLIVDFSSSIRSFPYLEFPHKCVFFSFTTTKNQIYDTSSMTLLEKHH